MSLPIEHLSASSLNLFSRCPRQWQSKYVHGIREPSNSSLVIGSAVHLALSRLFQNLDEAEAWPDAWADAVDEAGEGIVWRDDKDTARNIFQKHVYDYWELVGKHLAPRAVAMEQEISLEIPGVPIPVIGFVDLETESDVIDYKTTRYFSRKQVRLNPEWAIQLRIYQLAREKPAQIHVLTRSKSDPVVVPSSVDDNLYLDKATKKHVYELQRWIRAQYNGMVRLYEEYGDAEDWPGNPGHEWSAKYCRHEDCCANLVS